MQFERRLDRKLVFSILAAGILSFTGVVIETAMNVTFPSLMKEFSVSTALVQWITTGYLLVLAVVIPLSGYLKERFLMKRLFLTASGLFILGTLLGAWSPDFLLLLLGRILQGAGTGIALPLMFNIIMDQAPLNRLGFMVGAAMLVCALAPAVGPSIGGYIVSLWGWRMIFWAVLPLLLLSFVLGGLSVRQSPIFAGLPLMPWAFCTWPFPSPVFFWAARSWAMGASLLRRPFFLPVFYWLFSFSGRKRRNWQIRGNGRFSIWGL